MKERANILDLRNISETRSWMQTSYDLVNQFISEGGYRLFPDRLSLPKIISNDTTIQITHRWINLGVGVCPNNIRSWNKKYRVAFALLDKKNKSVKTLFIDNESNPHEWLKERATEYYFEIQTKNLNPGEYMWGVGIVDTSKENEPGINISVKGPITNGWVQLFDVSVL